MPVATASDRLAIEHQKDVAGVAGGVASAVISTAMGADPAAISTWFFSALDGLMARIQAGYALNRRSTMGYLPQHGALNRVTVSPIPGSLDIGSTRSRLGITGPVAFKNAISAGLGEDQALRSMATQMSGVADELVRNGDRDVIMNTIRRGKGLVAYRRRLAGKSCGFCAMIASRGAVYTAETSTFRTHPHCRCWAEPLYRHEREPIEVQRLQRQWQRVTAGKTGAAKQREWRKHWEQRATPAARAREGISELIPAPVAAATPVDPALKLTVANLRKIANDNGVNVAGVKLKADILGRLRNHEDIHKLTLPGLPEFKPPRAVTPRLNDIDAPPLGVPAGKPVLSGASLNDWADHFTYDRQYGRHVYVDANGNTPPEGIRVHNLRANIQGSFDTGLNEYTVRDGTAFSFDGIAYLIEHPPDQFGSPWVSKTLADLRRAHEDIPAAKLANKSYSALAGDNPSDAYWRGEFNNPDHVSAAMAAKGHLTLWQFRGPATPGGTFSRVNYDVLRHETGHNLDDLLGRQTHGSKSAAWDAAAKSDVGAASKITDLVEDTRGHGDLAKFDRTRDFPEGVTSYGRSSVGEDYAESVRLYQEGVIGRGRLAAGAETGPIYFRDLFPARAKILDDVFPDFAKAQKAEIAALRAPKPASFDAQIAQALDARLARAKTGGDALAAAPVRLSINEAGEPSLTGLSKLTPEERERIEQSVHLYATGTGSQLNDFLRAGRTMGDAELDALLGPFVRDIETALEHSALRSDVVVWRGVSRDVLGESRDLGDLTGVEWSEPTFVSTSAVRREAEAFGNVLLRMVAPKGSPALKISDLDGEAELLLAPGSRFRVVRDLGMQDRSRPGPAMRVIDVEIISPTKGSAGTAGADLSKLKVPELRALAKERGVTGYSKLTKPQLLEKLGGEPAPRPLLRGDEALDSVPYSFARSGENPLAANAKLIADPQERKRVDEAIEHYRRSGYLGANDLLRGIKSAAAGAYPDRIRAEIAEIDKALKVSRLRNDVELWRGIGSKDLTEKFLGQRDTWPSNLTGRTFEDLGFGSASISRHTGEHYSNGNVLLRIVAPRDTGAIALSRATYEGEILLDRGLTFRVTADHGMVPVGKLGKSARYLEVEVVPKAKVAKESAGDVLVTAARVRQADIDYARARAELLSETEEWLNNQGSLSTMAVQLRRDAARFGIEGHKDVAALFRAIDSGDAAKVRKAIETVAGKQKLTRVERAGEVVRYDRALHGDIGKDLKPGDLAVVVRPGYTFERNGETIRLHKAKVESATREEIEAAKIAEIASQVARRRHMVLGSMSRTERLELRNGERFIHKKITDPDVEFVKRQGDAEELGALVARATGLEAPTVYRAGAGELYMTFMDGELAVDAGILRSTRLAASPEGSVMKVLDYLIGNGDREGNGGNWLIGARGNIQVIDHAAAWGFGGNVPYDASLAAQLSRGDIDVLRSRIKSLRSEFERLGRGNWWRDTMSRIEELAKDAAGTRALIR